VLNDCATFKTAPSTNCASSTICSILSRAEIDELDLYLELIDPRPLLAEAFHSLAAVADPARNVVWQLQLPDRLPWLNADAVRLRQTLLNLLSNARKFTQKVPVRGRPQRPRHAPLGELARVAQQIEQCLP